MHKGKETFQIIENLYLSILYLFLQLQRCCSRYVYVYK